MAVFQAPNHTMHIFKDWHCAQLELSLGNPPGVIPAFLQENTSHFSPREVGVGVGELALNQDSPREIPPILPNSPRENQGESGSSPRFPQIPPVPPGKFTHND